MDYFPSAPILNSVEEWGDWYSNFTTVAIDEDIYDNVIATDARQPWLDREDDDFEDQAKAKTKLQQWIWKTVNDTLAKRLVELHDEDPNHWIEELKTYLNINEHSIRHVYERKFWAAMSKMSTAPTNPINYRDWVGDWYQTMIQCDVAGVGLAQSSRSWLPLLTSNIMATLPLWVEVFAQVHMDDITNDTVTFEAVAKSLRIRQKLIVAPLYTAGAALNTDAHTVEPTNQQSRGSGNYAMRGQRRPDGPSGNQHPNNRKRQRDQGTTNCLACDSYRHGVEVCWYVNRELRPPGFVGNPDIKRRINAKIEDPNSDLRQAIAAKKSRQDDVEDPAAFYRRIRNQSQAA